MTNLFDKLLMRHTLGPAADDIHVHSRKQSNQMKCTLDSKLARWRNDEYQAGATVIINCMVIHA